MPRAVVAVPEVGGVHEAVVGREVREQDGQASTASDFEAVLGEAVGNACVLGTSTRMATSKW
jgi:hypothetical protein